ncbi:hypothetical protein ABIB45_004128 [Arthrobacter sp. UYCo732]
MSVVRCLGDCFAGTEQVIAIYNKAERLADQLGGFVTEQCGAGSA